MARNKRNDGNGDRNDNNDNSIPSPKDGSPDNVPDGAVPGKAQPAGNNEKRQPTTDDRQEYKIREHNILKAGNAKTRITNLIKDKFQRAKTFVIAMHLRNGKHRTFLVTTKTKIFIYLDGSYVIDESCAYDNIDSKYMWLDYHQDFCLPIRRELDVKKLREAIATGDYNIVTATNPTVLTRELEAKLAEGAAKASAIPEIFKQIKMFLIITMLAAIIHLLLFVFKSGMLKSIKIPGVN